METDKKTPRLLLYSFQFLPEIGGMERQVEQMPMSSHVRIGR